MLKVRLGLRAPTKLRKGPMLAAVSESVSGPETIGQRLARRGGSTTGFDYLRIGLAIAVVFWHSLETSYSDGTSVRVWHAARGVISLILPAFFSLSGFLVCGSLIRTKSIWVFLTHRAVRIIPALSVEILLSALILGPALTTLPIQDYFKDGHFWLYFLNLVGDIHYILPGLFASNPNPSIVNKSLWTIPYELECYLALLILSYVGLVKRAVWLALLSLSVCVSMCLFVDLTNAAILGSIGPPGRLLVLSFLTGISLYLLRDKVTLSPTLLYVATCAAIISLSYSRLMFLSPLPVAYLTVWLGLRTPRHIPVLMDGDYSYGLYLFAYPLQQTYSALFIRQRHWYINAAVTIILGLLYAALSWHLVEKRVLSHRKRIVLFVERIAGLPRRYASTRASWKSLHKGDV